MDGAVTAVRLVGVVAESSGAGLSRIAKTFSGVILHLRSAAKVATKPPSPVRRAHPESSYAPASAGGPDQRQRNGCSRDWVLSAPRGTIYE